MSTKSAAKVVDGRKLRSERSRRAIIDAALALVEDGILIPTAQQISERAGVGIRSFFRHFEDMESLFAALDEQTRDSYEALFLGGDRDGTLEKRIVHAVECHSQAYEAAWSQILASQAQLWRSQTIRKNYARGQRGLRKNLQDWLPELKKLPKDQREAVDAVASFEFWHRLRAHQGLNRKKSSQIVTNLLKSLVESG